VILNEMKKCLEEERFEDYSEGNKRFHDVIYNVSNKPEAVELVRTFKTQLVRHQFRTILVTGRNSNSIKEHIRIYEALKNSNKKEAEKAVRTHVKNVAKTIKDYY